ncbi:MAG TPA: reverse transcriptase domain-containing protein [Candidatus Moranbacteria bacterium]|nr:reverse transcriptase domain-containing protein [Candidatus Moranbacteria bacterium]HRY27538.1 reverse transcriptase domain-containing protein [Candidatus Moranbacteria bacterium]HSA07767.1 reverse transcriptase domain-containing protein [Candidatus Moranbacteria bacterium]
MDLFDKFTSKENLKQAFLYLKYETDESSLPLDPIWRPSISAIVHLGDDFFETLQEYLRQGKYQPDKADYIYASKDNLGVRPICIFSVVDRIIFQALLNPSVLGNIIDKKLFSFCCGNRIASKEKFLKPYKNQWVFFCDKQIEAFEKKLTWRVEFDIQTYYENIHIDTLLKVLNEQFKINDAKILEILSKQLKSWSENPTMCGVPQGANASHILANAYLHPLDTFIDDLKSNGDFEYFRYADDIVIMSKSADTLNHIVDKLVLFLRSYNLRLNEKTKLEKLKNTSGIEELKFYNPYGNLNETSKQKIARIGKKIPTILRKIKNGNDTKKTEMSALKYYLKSGVDLGNTEMLNDLIALVLMRPSLTYLVCRYLGFYFSELNKFLYGAKEDIIHSKYERVWKTYHSNSLTDWTKFWLLKVLSAPLFAKNHTGFQMELDRIIADPKAKFFRPLAFFYRAYMKEKGDPSASLGFNLDDIKRHIRNAKTEGERATYYYFAVYLRDIEEDEAIKELVYEALQSKSLEIQTMGIFLVEKLHRLFGWLLVNEKKVDEKTVIEKYTPILEREIAGEFSKIYFNLQSSETLTKTKDEFLNDEGKIAQDKLAPFFGMSTTPLKIEVIGLQEGLKAIVATKLEAKQKFPHKLPAGTRWENFTIKFLDNENVFIQVKQFKENASYKDMGFIGKGNNPNPSGAWTFLKVLAQVNGELAIKNPEARDKYKKQKELLAKSLQDYFSLDYDPFYPYHTSSEKNGNSYKIKITLIPPLDKNTKSDNREDENNSDISEYLKKQTPEVFEE